jgi:hypothetical protein
MRFNNLVVRVTRRELRGGIEGRGLRDAAESGKGDLSGTRGGRRPFYLSLQNKSSDRTASDSLIATQIAAAE